MRIVDKRVQVRRRPFLRGIAAAVPAGALAGSVGKLDTQSRQEIRTASLEVPEETDRVTVLHAMAHTPFFNRVRSDLVVSFCNQRDLWRHFGCERSSSDYGGYINRGFDDVNRLPKVRARETNNMASDLNDDSVVVIVAPAPAVARGATNWRRKASRTRAKDKLGVTRTNGIPGLPGNNNYKVMEAGARKLGYTQVSTGRMPINSRPRHGRGSCQQIGFCSEGCKSGTKWSTL